jgi:hypothetical protein
MIKPNELRVGNLLKHKGAIVEINGIEDDTDTYHETWIVWVRATALVHPIADFDPIPLTPEWLERCGFVKLSHLGRKEHTLYIDENLSIEACEYQELLIRLVISQDNYDENINIGVFTVYREISECKYVHQLQNLFFALTGEELTLKETV